MLCPRDYPMGTKRMCVDTNCYATFNRDNVILIDLRQTPIETLTQHGVRTTAGEYKVDAIVFAIGFDAMTGSLTRIDIRGRRGQALRDKWEQGQRTLSRPRRHRLSQFFHDHRAGEPVGAQQHDCVHRAAR